MMAGSRGDGGILQTEAERERERATERERDEWERIESNVKREVMGEC